MSTLKLLKSESKLLALFFRAFYNALKLGDTPFIC
ncbi:hypothetical protein TMEC54S_00428 [Thauera mechernichensis]|jgi:hypothetical protein